MSEARDQISSYLLGELERRRGRRLRAPAGG